MSVIGFAASPGDRSASREFHRNDDAVHAGQHSRAQLLKLYGPRAIVIDDGEGTIHSRNLRSTVKASLRLAGFRPQRT
jgi:hypothetical protein